MNSHNYNHGIILFIYLLTYILYIFMSLLLHCLLWHGVNIQLFTPFICFQFPNRRMSLTTQVVVTPGCPETTASAATLARHPADSPLQMRVRLRLKGICVGVDTLCRMLVILIMI